jgi:hypothetical protein
MVVVEREREREERDGLGTEISRSFKTDDLNGSPSRLHVTSNYQAAKTLSLSPSECRPTSTGDG